MHCVQGGMDGSPARYGSRFPQPRPLREAARSQLQGSSGTLLVVVAAEHFR